jgi:cytochrome c oxidase subunit 3
MAQEFESIEEGARKIRAKKMLLYLTIFSIVMFFAGLTSAFIVIQADTFWVEFAMPQAFFVSTAIILLSSLTGNLAVKAAKKSQYEQLTRMLGLTLLLGLAFGVTQYIGWGQMIERGHYMVGNIEHVEGEYGKDHIFTYKGKELIKEDGDFYLPGDRRRENPLKAELMAQRNTASSFIYVLTVAHVLHLLGGIFYLASLWFKSRRKRFDASNNVKVRLGITYWHFLDGLWIFLLSFFLYIH